jgi:hypothetical protein
MSIPSSSSYFAMSSASATSTPESSPPSDSSPIAQHQPISHKSTPTYTLSSSLSSCSSSSSSEAGSSSQQKQEVSSPKRLKPKKRVSFADDTHDGEHKEWVPSGIPGVGPTRQSSLKWRGYTGSAVFQLDLSQEELSRTTNASHKYSEGIIASFS